VAAQIYRRLLEKEPENKKILARLKEIEAAAEAAGQAAASSPGPAAETEAQRKAKASYKKRKSGVYHHRRTMHDERPLKGVRIKKKVKEKLRKRFRKST